MNSMKNYLLTLSLSIFIVPTIIACDFSNSITAMHQNLISEVEKMHAAIDDLCNMSDHENAQELLTTGLSLTLAITCSMPEMDDDIASQKLGEHYDEFVSLGHEFTNFNKNKFIHDSKILITELRANPKLIEYLENKELLDSDKTSSIASDLTCNNQDEWTFLPDNK